MEFVVALTGLRNSHIDCNSLFGRMEVVVMQTAEIIIIMIGTSWLIYMVGYANGRWKKHKDELDE